VVWPVLLLVDGGPAHGGAGWDWVCVGVDLGVGRREGDGDAVGMRGWRRFLLLQLWLLLQLLMLQGLLLRRSLLLFLLLQQWLLRRRLHRRSGVDGGPAWLRWCGLRMLLRMWWCVLLLWPIW
jgi:hypothetical protein